jgi:type I restriction enzyme R subunit
MVGRGTRLCPDVFGPGQDKEYFYIFDYCQNLEFFGERPEGYEAPVQESVKTKIFKRRLAVTELLAAKLDGQSGSSEAEGESLTKLRDDLLDQMHEVVKRLDTDNFIVRPRRRYVEAYADRQRWSELSTGDVVDIAQHLTPLPYEDDDEEMARRFDLLMLNLQLAILESSPSQERYQRQVMELMGNLEEKQAIPTVARQLDLILEIQRDEYWQHVTLPMIESARRKLRDLIKFIDHHGGQETVYTTFMDDIGDGTEIHGLVQADPRLKNYRLRVERFIRDHETHPTIQRIKTNQPLHAGDIDSLEAILFAEDGPGTREEFIETYGSAEPLGALVRRIIGLDRNAAKNALSDFLAEGTYSADQIRFVNLIVDHLAANGLMDPAMLFEPPFTDFHAEGVIGVLGDDAEKVVGVLKRINLNAIAT